MTLTNSKIQTLHTVLIRLEPLDGNCPKCGEPIPIPESARTSVFVGGRARYNIARNLKLLSTVLEEIEAMRVKLVKERIAPGQNELSDEALAEFRRLYAEIMDTTNDVPLHTVTIAEVDLDQVNPRLLAELLDTVIVNPIPPPPELAGQIAVVVEDEPAKR